MPILLKEKVIKLLVLIITFESIWEEIVEDTAYTNKDLALSIDDLEHNNLLSVTRVSSKRGSYREKDIIYVK